MVALARRDEPWFPGAFAALERIWAGTGDDWDAVMPFFHGRWDAAAREYQADGVQQQNEAAAAAYYAPGAVDEAATRSALGGLAAAVLVMAGEYDVSLPPVSAAALAALFPHAEVAVAPRAAHSPWRDDPAWFVTTVDRFLA
jgi:pimeloyl-ACP methyl ester carboxylesterase